MDKLNTRIDYRARPLGDTVARTPVGVDGRTRDGRGRTERDGENAALLLTVEPGVSDAMCHVLVVEDDPGIRNLLRVLLTSAGLRVTEVETAARADVAARTQKPDLLLLDLGLPDADGLDVIRQARTWSPVPIIVVSARAAESEKIAVLDAGADDYVTKPFAAPELLARVRSALRRRIVDRSPTHVLKFGDLQIDVTRRISRAPPGEVHFNDSRSVRVYIWNLRRKIELDPQRPRYLVTYPGVGYRLEPDPTVF